MNIGFDAKRALNNHTGLGLYSRNLLNALFQHYPQESYHLFSAAINEELLAELKGVFRIHTPHTVLNEMFPALWRSHGVVRDLKANRIQVYHGLSNEIPTFDSSSRYIKKVVTIHDLIVYRDDLNTLPEALAPAHVRAGDEVLLEGNEVVICRFQLGEVEGINQFLECHGSGLQQFIRHFNFFSEA